MDLWTSIDLERFIPWAFFFAGFGGSLHCVGMCGGLVAASCSKKGDVLSYQLGRGLAYLVLGGLAGGFGLLLNLKELPFGVRLLLPILLGSLFIYWGVLGLLKKKSAILVPRFLSQTYVSLYRRMSPGSSSGRRSFTIGLLSIFLPCGMLYGVVLSTLAFQSFTMGAVGMFFFWLGTLPSMVIAPTLVRSVLRPLKFRLPRFYGTALIVIGILTISFRITGELKTQERSASEQHCHSRLK